MNKTAGIDWVKAERFYRAGIISVQAIADKLGCTRQGIYKKAKEKAWTRDLAPRIKGRSVVSCQRVNEPDCQLPTSAPVNEPVEPTETKDAQHIVPAPVDIEAAHAREDEALVEAAAREIVSVTQAHRIEAARLIDIARDLGGKLADLVHGRAVAFEAKTKDGSKVRVAFLGENESAADALGKVTRALKHLVDIERKAFAMDEAADNPGGKSRSFVPLEERLATYRKEEAIAAADNVVKMYKQGEPPELGARPPPTAP